MQLIVFDRDGGRHVLPAAAGSSVMEVIRDDGLPIAARCGGCCSCATCHVYVADEWLDKLAPLEEEEEALLELTIEPQACSRLACQIVMQANMDGLVVTLAPGDDV